MKQVITNWGLYPAKECKVLVPENYTDVAEVLADQPHIIARGNGRCYGDASLARVVVSTVKLKNIIHFDAATGIICCQAGVLLSDILELVVPKGYFLPITPGTKFITVGGAFSSDIHGKNHHVDGVFSDHVLTVKLMNAEGQILDLHPGEELFEMTAGGMGATGIILEVTFALRRIETAYIRQTSIRARNLREIFELFEQHQHTTYSVAWIDCLASGTHLGRSVLLLGEHALRSEVKNKQPLIVHKAPSLRVPFFFPSWFLSSLFIRLFNMVFYHKPSSAQINKIVHYDPYFYPLDKIYDWNRIYGRKGFVQYQFVIPKERSYETVKEILDILSRNKLGSFLAVLKLFGKAHDNRYLHFPIEGYTLALDIKITDTMWPVLDTIDQMVTAAGGKIYLTKDARLSKTMYDKQYQNKIAAGAKFVSDQMIRLAQDKQDVFLIVGANSDIAKEAALAYLKQHPNGHLMLASRNTQQVTEFVIAQGLQDRSTVLHCDVTQAQNAAAFVQQLPFKPAVVLYAAGVLVENESCFHNAQQWLDNVSVNFTGAVALLNALVTDNNPLLRRIVGITSIAGLRGRKSNFMYGAAKAGFHQYLFGLRQVLKGRGILVQALTPGVVDTKMTRHIANKKKVSTPSAVAARMFNNSKAFELYPDLFWQLVAQMVRVLPEWLVAKL